MPVLVNTELTSGLTATPGHQDPAARGRRRRDRRRAEVPALRRVRAQVGRDDPQARHRAAARRSRGRRPRAEGRPRAARDRPVAAPRLRGCAPRTPSRRSTARRSPRSCPAAGTRTAGLGLRAQPVGDLRRPISGPWSSCRKWLASAIVSGGGRPSASAKRSPTLSGMTGSESAHSISAGRVSSRSASSTRWPAAAPGISGVIGSISGNARAPALDSGLGIGRVVGGRDLVAGVGLARAAHEHADRQVLGALDEVAERVPRGVHLLVAGEEAGVHDHDAADPVGMLDREAQPDRPAPVVHDDRWRRAGRALRAAARASRCGGRSCTSRCRPACPSGRSRPCRAPRSESRRRAAAASPCGTGMTTSARRAGGAPEAPSPSSRCASRSPSTSR